MVMECLVKIKSYHLFHRKESFVALAHVQLYHAFPQRYRNAPASLTITSKNNHADIVTRNKETGNPGIFCLIRLETTGFKPTTSRPPVVHSNQTKPHPITHILLWQSELEKRVVSVTGEVPDNLEHRSTRSGPRLCQTTQRHNCRRYRRPWSPSQTKHLRLS